MSSVHFPAVFVIAPPTDSNNVINRIKNYIHVINIISSSHSLGHIATSSSKKY